MEKLEVWLGLGSNLQNRNNNLIKGLTLLGDIFDITTVSSIYETEPWGYRNQPKFLNCACIITTDMLPDVLLKTLMGIEKMVGRKKSFHYGPRTLDLDILFYGTHIIKTSTLEIPHPQLSSRAFVLVPLSEISPNLNHPQLNKSISELLHNLDDTDTVTFSGPPPNANSYGIYSS